MRAIPLSIVVLLLGTSSPALAGGQDSAAAEALFREGRDAAKHGDPATACARFVESQRLDPAAGTLLNIADCEEKLGNVASAWAHLREALDALTPDDDRVAAASKHAAALEARLPYLVVRLAKDAPREAHIERDGAVLGTASLGVPIPVDPGRHRITVQAAGHRPRVYVLDVAETKRVDVVVDVGETEPAGAASPSRALVAGEGSRTLGYGLLAAGGVALGAGAVLGLFAIDRNGTMNDHCDPGRVCDTIGLDAGRSGRIFDVGSTIGFIAAGALIAGGLVWIVTHPSHPARAAARAANEGP